MGEGALCAVCEARRRPFARARAACLYDDHSRELILQLKHADRTDLAPLFARWLARAAAPLLEEAQAIVPVPLHRWRLLRRRYNQAAEIARPLSALSGVPYVAAALIRRRDTATQAGRSGAGRRRNVAAAFYVPGRNRGKIEGKTVLLVDDVLTTGATAEGCARALLRAGAASVSVAMALLSISSFSNGADKARTAASPAVSKTGTRYLVTHLSQRRSVSAVSSRRALRHM